MLPPGAGDGVGDGDGFGLGVGPAGGGTLGVGLAVGVGLPPPLSSLLLPLSQLIIAKVKKAAHKNKVKCSSPYFLIDR
jgi:hypothetical protein